MKDYFTTRVGFFQLVATLEGISFLVLLGIAMPVKYLLHESWLVQKVGMAHGVLFIGYVYLVFIFRNNFNWNLKETLIALAGSVLPFGTFYVTRKMLGNVKS